MSSQKANFGKLLRKTRAEAGFSMGQLARDLAVNVSYVSDVERGVRAPFTKENIIRAAKFLGVDSRPLLAAGAASRGVFELKATGVTETARRVGAALMRGWPELSEDQLKQISRIIEEE
jgi:transcriptional regulator with XRE-family HTH domain